MSDARLDEIVDWERFREEVYLAVRDGVRHYIEKRKGSNAEPVVQALLWTDSQAHVTGFELLTYDARLRIGAFRVEQIDGQVQRTPLGTAGYGGWDFGRYHLIVNESLQPLYALEWQSQEGNDAVQARLGIELPAVAARLIDEKVLHALPRRGEFHFEVEWLLD